MTLPLANHVPPTGGLVRTADGFVELIDGPHGMTSRVYLQHAAVCTIAVRQRKLAECHPEYTAPRAVVEVRPGSYLVVTRSHAQRSHLPIVGELI